MFAPPNVSWSPPSQGLPTYLWMKESEYGLPHTLGQPPVLDEDDVGEPVPGLPDSSDEAEGEVSKLRNKKGYKQELFRRMSQGYPIVL
eukprot:310281-Amphidinium_carterae.1